MVLVCGLRLRGLGFVGLWFRSWWPVGSSTPPCDAGNLAMPRIRLGRTISLSNSESVQEIYSYNHLKRNLDGSFLRVLVRTYG